MAPGEVAQFPPGTKVNLSMLIDFILQKTYHEITILSELLPRKSDIERKIEIIQFATKSRQQFIRLLALVKWAASADKADKCQAISTFLDQQNMFFVDTADMLARMSRDTLVKARLPNFSLPAAIDVLTTGKFNRLPRCIRDRIVPPDPISATDKKRTLMRLSEVIQHRLVTTNTPAEFTSISIGDGKAKLRVENEFEVTLVLMGDEPTIPWRLLKIEFLIKDFETGDGKALVHDIQIQYIHQLVQSRLVVEHEPLVDLYRCLHYFAMSLQLEVFHTQAARLINERWRDTVKIEEYIPGRKLEVSYWRSGFVGQLADERNGNVRQPPKFIIKSPGAENEPLTLHQEPELSLGGDLFQSHEFIKIAASCLSIERILALVKMERARSMLKPSTPWSPKERCIFTSALHLHENSWYYKDLLKSLQEDSFFQENAYLMEDVPRISINPFRGCRETEVVTLSIDSCTGAPTMKISEKIKGKEKIAEMERLLLSDHKQFVAVFHRLRCIINLERCVKAVRALPVRPVYHLPLTNLTNHPLAKLEKPRLYLQFNKHQHFCLVIEVKVDQSKVMKPLVENVFLLNLQLDEDPFPLNGAKARTKSDSDSEKVQGITDSKETARARLQSQNVGKAQCFLKAGNMVQLDPEAFDYEATGNRFQAEVVKPKRKINPGPDDTLEKKRKLEDEMAKEIEGGDERHISDRLNTIISSCNCRIPFIQLQSELTRASIPPQGLFVSSTGVSLHLLEFPVLRGFKPKLNKELQCSVLRCSVHLTKNLKAYNVVYKFCRRPFGPEEQRDSAGKLPLYADFVYRRLDTDMEGSSEKSTKLSVVYKLVSDWKAMLILFEQAKNLADYLRDDTSELFGKFLVESYNYKSLVLSYGPEWCYKVTFEVEPMSSLFRVRFGITGQRQEQNPQLLIQSFLQKELNQHHNMAYTLKIILYTISPLQALAKVVVKPSLGGTTRALSPSKNFTIIAQSSTHVKLFYRNVYALDIFLMASKVMLRDGAITKTDPSKALPWISFAAQLTAFLQLFAEVSSASGYLGTENPVTPGTIEFDPIIPDSYGTPSSGHDFSPQGMVNATRDMSAHSPVVSLSSPSQASVGYGVTSVASPGNIYSTPSPGTFLHPSPGGHDFAPLASPLSWQQGSPLVQRQGAISSTSMTQQQGKSPASSASVSLTPVFVSFSSFAKLITPVEQKLPGKYTRVISSPLQNFYGAILLRGILVRVVKGDDSLHFEKADLSVVSFYGLPEAGLQYNVHLNPHSMDSLQLKATAKSNYESIWSTDELRVLEQFFEVVCAPCKVNVLTAFLRLLGAHPKILKDAIKIMRLELNPEPSHKWRVSWCFMTPLSASSPIAAPGTPAVVVSKAKNLFFFRFTDMQDETCFFTLTILYDPKSNTTQPLDLPRVAGAPSEPPSRASGIKQSKHAYLKQISETFPKSECTLFPSILALVR